MERFSFDSYLKSLTMLIRAYSMLKNVSSESLPNEQEISMERILSDLCLDKDEYELLSIHLLK